MANIEYDNLPAADLEPWRADLMLREANHRVSNHLQILASLIGMQAREASEPGVREAMMSTHWRVLAIARLHEDLGGPGDETTINVAAFLGRLVEDFRLCFGGEGPGCTDLEVEIAPIFLPSETAVTLALILNELVSNAIKHAVRLNGGAVQIRLYRHHSGDWRLAVSDHGPGISEDVLEAAEGERGLGLVKLLARKIRGKVVTERGGAYGATVAMNFHLVDGPVRRLSERRVSKSEGAGKP